MGNLPFQKKLNTLWSTTGIVPSILLLIFFTKYRELESLNTTPSELKVENSKASSSIWEVKTHLESNLDQKCLSEITLPSNMMLS